MPRGAAVHFAAVGRRILIIEEESEARDTLAGALAAKGADVVVARDGRAGLEQLRGGLEPCVVLVDARPRLDADAFIRELRGDTRFERLPVISMAPGADGGDAAELGAGTGGARPFDADDLLHIVLSFCDELQG